MELGGEFGRGIIGSLVAGKGNLNGVEVPNGPWHGQVHIAELVDEALQFLDLYVALGGGYLQKGEDI